MHENVLRRAAMRAMRLQQQESQIADPLAPSPAGRQGDHLRHAPEDHHFYLATHTAWAVETEEELIAWKETLEGRGINGEIAE
jgi:hypothetical protein